MVNYRDPVVIAQNYALLKHVWHATNGIYIWEFLTTLNYEWSVIRGRRPYRWTMWIYFLTRLTTLATIILVTIGMNVTTPYNCQVWITATLTTGNLGFASASLLIVFRIIAIWNRNTVAVTIAAGAWLTNVVFMARGIVRVRAEWEPSARNCVVVNNQSCKPTIIMVLTNDIVLLLIMLVGLIRLRRQGSGRFGLGSLLWKQGVLWFILATVAEVPPTVLIILNLNEPLNLMYQLPSLITISIAVTRMHRSLVDFVHGTTDIASDNLQNGDIGVPKTKLSALRFNPIEVAVDRSYEHFQISNASHCGSYVHIHGQLGAKLQDMSPTENDLENGSMETRVPRS